MTGRLKMRGLYSHVTWLTVLAVASTNTLLLPLHGNNGTFYRSHLNQDFCLWFDRQLNTVTNPTRRHLHVRVNW